VEHAEWMNEQVRGEIEALKHNYGFEEDEAIAFWHIQLAGKLMNEMRRADLHKKLDLYEGRDDYGAWQQAALLDHTGQWYSGVHQHFMALRCALGNRVLSRDYPDGWGWSRLDENEEQG
jgi:hypothetical protein